MTLGIHLQRGRRLAASSFQRRASDVAIGPKRPDQLTELISGVEGKADLLRTLPREVKWA